MISVYFSHTFPNARTSPSISTFLFPRSSSSFPSMKSYPPGFPHPSLNEQFTPDHSASSTPLPPPRPHGRGGGRSPLDNTSLSPSSKNSPHKSLSPDRPIDQPAVARSSLSPARSSPKPTSPLSQRHLVSNNHLVMEEGKSVG